MVNLNSVPTTNTSALRISLLNAGNIVTSLDPDEARVLTTSFDQVLLVNPGLPPVIRIQNPAGVVTTASPGNIAYFTTVGGTALHFAIPGQQETVVSFI